MQGWHLDHDKLGLLLWWNEHYVYNEWMTDTTFQKTNSDHTWHITTNRKTNQQHRKAEIRQWLDKHTVTRTLLYMYLIISQTTSTKTTVPDWWSDTWRNGYLVLHLSCCPGHCELNPIELARALVKGYIARHNKDYNLKDVERLVPLGFKHTTADMWSKV